MTGSPNSHWPELGFTFGFFDVAEVPGPLLIQVFDDLGISPAATRTLFSRMSAKRQLESRKVGRVALYRLAGAFRSRYLRLRHHPGPAQWNGSLHTVIYDIPEANRSLRDEVRRIADAHGYGLPRPGVLIGLEAPEWAEHILRANPDVMLERAVMSCDLPTARRLAERAWHLEDHARRLRGECARVRTLIERADPIPSGPAALRSCRDLWTHFSAVMLEVPRLPAEFLPEDWAADELRRLTLHYDQRHDAPLNAYKDDLLRHSPHAHLLTLGENSDAIMP